MAEFCKDCARTALGFSESELRRSVLSKEPELCEGCGEIKPVIIRIRPTLGEKIRAIFGR